MPYEDIDAMLTGPGGPLEIIDDDVLGERMRVFKDRKRSLRELLLDSVAFADKPYIVIDERRISYAEHLNQVAAMARVLRDRFGVGKGDRVAILAENHPEWIITFWATVSLGAIVAALNGWWTSDEIRYGVELSEPKLLVVDQKRRQRLQGLQGLAVPTLEMESEVRAIVANAPAAELPPAEIDEDDPAVILFTSGTTGRPKGAVNTHRGICGFVQSAYLGGMRTMMLSMEHGETPDRPETCALMTVPLFHLSGLYTGAVLMLVVGAKTVWRLGRFEPLEVLRLIERERVTTWAGLGSMAPRVLSHPDLEKYDLSSMRNFGSGGAPTSPKLQERMRQVAPNGKWGVGLGYGSSESVTAVAMISGHELSEHPTSVGRPQPTHEIQIRAADGVTVLGEDQEGEIFIRSPYVMRGYWRDAAATAKAIRSGRWLATGDIGRIKAGRLYINSRARDMILRAAENIYPVEIEHRLEEHPSVAEAAVVGVEHPELGQEIKAILVPSAGATIDTSELARWVGAKLAPFKVPAHWEIRSEPLPRNPAGKVLKNVLTGESENRFVDE